MFFYDMSGQFVCVWLYFQGSSTIFPIVPIGLVIGLQVMIATKTSIFTDQPCLYLISFGFVSSKITNSLVVSRSFVFLL